MEILQDVADDPSNRSEGLLDPNKDGDDSGGELGNTNTAPEETTSDSGAGMTGTLGPGDVDRDLDESSDDSGLTTSPSDTGVQGPGETADELDESSTDQGGLSTTPTDTGVQGPGDTATEQDSQTTEGDDSNMTNDQTGGLTDGTTEEQSDQSTGESGSDSGPMAIVSERPALAVGAVAVAGIAAKKGGVI